MDSNELKKLNCWVKVSLGWHESHLAVRIVVSKRIFMNGTSVLRGASLPR